MIISDEEKIFELLEKYEEHSDEAALKESVIALVRPKQSKQLEGSLLTIRWEWFHCGR
jgi:hypothetical protein